MDLFSSFRMVNGSEPFTYEVTNVDGLFKFIKTIDWSERWLISLVLFHLVSFIAILKTNRCSNFQMVLFFVLIGLCFGSQKLNELGAKYWRLFSMEQYFDSNGLFISVVFSAPMILNCCLIIILWLYECYSTLIRIIKLKKQAINKKKDAKNDEKKEK